MKKVYFCAVDLSTLLLSTRFAVVLCLDDTLGFLLKCFPIFLFSL